jgi:hypothetical protein
MAHKGMKEGQRSEKLPLTFSVAKRPVRTISISFLCHPFCCLHRRFLLSSGMTSAGANDLIEAVSDSRFCSLPKCHGTLIERVVSELAAKGASVAS